MPKVSKQNLFLTEIGIEITVIGRLIVILVMAIK